MKLVKFFVKNGRSLLDTNRKEKESIILKRANSQRQRENLLAELGRAEKIWQTPDPATESSNFLW